ncbi:MAG TPA: hypothetical protein VGD29_27720, partial [Actinoplanes sp.]
MEPGSGRAGWSGPEGFAGDGTAGRCGPTGRGGAGRGTAGAVSVGPSPWSDGAAPAIELKAERSGSVPLAVRVGASPLVVVWEPLAVGMSSEPDASAIGLSRGRASAFRSALWRPAVPGLVSSASGRPVVFGAASGRTEGRTGVQAGPWLPCVPSGFASIVAAEADAETASAGAGVGRGSPVGPSKPGRDLSPAPCAGADGSLYGRSGKGRPTRGESARVSPVAAQSVAAGPVTTETSWCDGCTACRA